ncbi:MAG: hypothetical protein AAGN66_07575 [Acidobacteriota bacterium]
MPTTLPERRPPAVPPAAPSGGPFRGPQGFMLAVTVAAAVAVVALPFLDRTGGNRAPLEVSIEPPTVTFADGEQSQGDGETLNRAAEAVLDTVERTLAGRRGLVTASADSAPGEHLHRETLAIELECDAEGCLGTLERRRPAASRVRGRRPAFRFDLGDPRDIDRKVGTEVHLAYLRYRRLQDGPQLFVRADDYRRYLDVRLAMGRSTADGDAGPLFEALAAVRGGSPRFSDAYLLEARLRLRSGEVGTAVDLLRSAHRIAPGDRRVLVLLADRLAEMGRAEDAAPYLRRLDQLWPGAASPWPPRP